MSKFIANPARSKHLSPNFVGGKAHSLIQLAHLDIPVPQFYILTTASYLLYKKSPQRFDDKVANFFKGKNFPVSVRSSAPFEDTISFSLAGQLCSVLDLQNIEQLQTGIRTVFASLEEKHLQTYLAQFLKSEQSKIMAAVVQRMVFPQIAGVIFTKHPLEPESNHLYIEVIHGSCENLVSGKSNPTAITLDHAGHIISKSDERFKRYEAQLGKLVKMALRIEKHYHSPQDIEWGIDGDQIWILQSRPITSFSNIHLITDEKGVVWTDYFYAERFVDPISPLGWDYIRIPIEKNAFQDTLWYLGKSLPKGQPLSKLHNGRPFTNLSAFQQIYSIVPPAFISADKQSGLRLSSKFPIFQFLKSLPFIFLRMLFKDFQWIPEVNVRKWRWIENNFARRLALLKKQISTNNMNSNYDIFRETENLTMEFLSNHRWAITFADIFSDLLVKFLSFYNIDVSSKVLLGGIENNTVKANLALEHLDVNNEKEIIQFLDKYGHRAKSLDIYQETWSEHFDDLIKIIHKKQRSIQLEFEQKKTDRENAVHSVKKQLNKMPFFSGIIGKFVFSKIYSYSCEFTLLRENQRDLWQQILALARHSALNIANTLMEQKKFTDCNLIFFFNKKEFYTLPKHSAYLTQFIEKAKIRQQTYLALLNETIDIPIDKNKKIYTGMSVSTSQAIGRVRVAHSYNEAFLCEPGEILVVRSADPAWSPVFQLAAGLVMETGGILSHASIVAREFGLATVTGIAGATQIFKTGELLKVDGKSGVVMKIAGEDNGLNK